MRNLFKSKSILISLITTLVGVGVVAAILLDKKSRKRFLEEFEDYGVENYDLFKKDMGIFQD